MKKFSILFFAFVILVSAVTFVGCEQGEELNCFVPDGAPALAVANIIKTQKIGNHSVQTTVTTGENVVAKCQNGEADLAILPTNAAVTVCSVRSEYCFFSVNVQGLLYLVGTQEVNELSDLCGETVYSIGLGNTPEFVFKKLLDHKGVDYTTAKGVDLQYVADGSTVIPLVLKGNAKFALLGEPAVTNLINKAASQNKTVLRLFDLQKLWQEFTGSSNVGYPQAGLVVKRSLLKGAFAKTLMQCLKDNAKFLQQNCQELNSLMQQAGSSLDVNYTADLLERCNLTALSAKSIKADLDAYLSTFAAMQKYLPLNENIFYEQMD